MNTECKIAICTGEASGDEHGAALCTALFASNAGLQIRGMGGALLRTAGVDTVVDSEHSASVMGFHDVVKSATRIIAAFNSMKRLLCEWKPEILILIDFPDFNLRLARFAKSRGIKVLYFITPQVWAWRKSRVHDLRKFIDYCAVIFPFESAFFRAHGLENVVYVGHPLADRTSKLSLQDAERSDFLFSHKLNPNNPVIALFPGSRKPEISRHLPSMLAGFEKLKSKYPIIQGAVAVAHSLSDSLFTPHILRSKEIKLCRGDSFQLLRCADAGLLKSGTSNLQAAFAGLPFAMLYKVPASTELVVRMFVKVKEYSIVNVLKPGTVKELLQRDASVDSIATELEALLFDKLKRTNIKQSFAEITHTLSDHDRLQLFEGCRSCYERVAKLVLHLDKASSASAGFAAAHPTAALTA